MTILASKLPLNSVEINATDFLPSALSGPRRETSPGGIQVYVRYGGTRARLIVVQIERHSHLSDTVPRDGAMKEG
jgi:hypothetical protein